MTAAATAPPIPGRPDPTARSIRRLGEIEKWRRHSRIVRRLRRGLPAAIGAILILLTGWVAVRAVLTRIGDARDSTALIHMSNARFFGRDGDGRAYVLAAQEAARDDADFQRIQLRGAVLTLNLDGPDQTRISADRGVYRENDRILRLNGHVVFRDGSGDVLVTEQAVVDTINGSIVGASRIRGTGPTGAIVADSFEIFDRGRQLVFHGDVHSRLKQG
jgi:lipopolysaccharide export system protein LptC